MEQYRFQPDASDSDKDGDNGCDSEDANAGSMFTTDW